MPIIHRSAIIQFQILLAFALRILPVVLLLLLFPPLSLARPLTSLDLIEKAYRNGEIDYGKVLNYKVMAVLRPEGLPEGLRSNVPIKSATPVMIEARSNRHLLSPENAKFLARGRIDTLTAYYGSGVTLHSYMSPGRRFRIHYTTEGDDAVPATDDNGNSIPDYVEKFGGILDHVWDKEVNEMGYDAPPSDGVEGGDCLLDVYLADIAAYGFTQIDEGMPVSTVYMIFENDFAGPDFPGNSNPGGVQEGDMKVTAAHEFFHAIQFQITDDIPINGWWMEASATWMEDHVYPEVNDYVNYISTFLEHPQVPLNFYSIYTLTLFPYGVTLWAKHLTEKYGSKLVYDIWGKIKNGESALTGIEKTLIERGSTLEEELKEFRVANVTLPYDDGQVFRTWDTTPIRVSYTSYSDFTKPVAINDVLLDELSAIYYSFSAPDGSGSLSLEFNGEGNIRVMVIGIHSAGYDVTEILLNELNEGSIDVRDFGSTGTYTTVIVIPLNYSTETQSRFSLTATYASTSSPVVTDVEIRPSSTSLVAEDAGSGMRGKQQYFVILRDKISNRQFLKKGTAWTSSNSITINVDQNGLAIASEAMEGAQITAMFQAYYDTASLSVSNPASITPGATRNCTISSNSDGRCFIATAAFGSPLHPYVQILREFRDRYLLTNDIGRKMVSLYYFYSPLAAEAITEDAALRAGVQISLIPVIIFSAFMVKTTMIEKVVVGTLLLLVVLYVVKARKHHLAVRL